MSETEQTEQQAGDEPQATEQEVRAQVRQHLQTMIGEHPVILFMKGSPDAPACGFSARAAGVLDALQVRYGAVDIFAHPFIREELSEISGWPTIPQLFVKGELVGGSDIMIEMYESGELAPLLGVEAPDPDQTPAVETEAKPPPLQLKNNLE